MSDYAISTNFATKDALPSGNPAKIVKGTELATEFNNLVTAIASKADEIDPTFTGTASFVALTASGTVSLPSTTTIGNVSATELSYLDGATSALQTQLDKMPGVGQTWQDLTASRAINTLYTNSTSKPIQVYALVRGSVASSTVAASWTIAGVTNIGGFDQVAASTPTNTSVFAMATVPPGAAYTLVVSQGTLSYWRELR